LGLLDGNLDPQSLASLQLAGGLLSPGSFGQGLSRGLSGYQGSLAASQEMDAKRQALEMQKLQFAVAMRKQSLINDYLAGGQPDQSPSAAPTQPSIMAGAPGTTPPTSPNSPMNPNMGAPPMGQGPQASGRPFGGLPRDQAMPDLLFNDGKNIATLVKDYQTPTMGRAGGFMTYRDGRMVQLPAVPEGFTTSVQPDGSFKIVPVEGGPAAVAASSAAKAAGPAGFKQTDVIGPGNTPYKVFNKDLPSFAPPSSRPGAIPPAVQASRDSDAYAIIKAEYDKEPPGPNKDALGREVARMNAGASPVGLPPGAVQTGLAPGVAKEAESRAGNAQNLMSDSYKTILGNNGSAQTVQARLEEIRNFSKSAILGGETQWRDFANNLASIAGVSDKATDRKTAGDLLEKNASQIALAIGTGSQGTDALRSLAASANPGRHMTQGAINTAVDQLQAAAQVQQAKAQLLTPHYNAGNTANYLSTEQQFDKNADYRVFQLHGMTPQQAQTYRAQMGEKAWAELQTKAKALKGLGVF
jgi:hypothetical protein